MLKKNGLIQQVIIHIKYLSIKRGAHNMQVIIMPSVNIIGSILFELPITQSSYLKSIIDQEM